MGDFTNYVESGGFSEYLYHDVGEIITADNGVQGKVVNKYTDPNDENFHDSLPTYSNTSEVYFKKSDEEDHPVEQARVYKNRQPSLDFDWNHAHNNYKEGVVHVHEWVKNENGGWTRKPPRYMNNEEIARYGDLIKKANPKTKLR